ncbi:hypothetical protein ETD86_40740 [Nonomuraea turkmeniaca]|uniref:Uncharacterized protein n=1 Tax=Nonomuraea turkmeniaca TaxID=103838 RepID=A0A5S4F254_9ACTN|nr:hypothetical protein ETD86_40740 [Nonomuraea turkmeniaca]
MDQLLGRTEVPVAAATRMVSETWTPVVSPPPVAPTRRPRRSWLPVVVGVLAAVLGAGVTLAVVRPWEERGSQPGTPAVAATIEALGSTFRVQVDSLTRQGTTARLQWTVKNVGKDNAPLYDKLGKDIFDHTVSKVSIVPPGVGNPIYPARKGDACQCAELPSAPFEGGTQLQLWAVFGGLPEDAAKVDVNLGPLGVIKNVAVTSG